MARDGPAGGELAAQLLAAGAVIDRFAQVEPGQVEAACIAGGLMARHPWKQCRRPQALDCAGHEARRVLPARQHLSGGPRRIGEAPAQTRIVQNAAERRAQRPAVAGRRPSGPRRRARSRPPRRPVVQTIGSPRGHRLGQHHAVALEKRCHTKRSAAVVKACRLPCRGRAGERDLRPKPGVARCAPPAPRGRPRRGCGPAMVSRQSRSRNGASARTRTS